jgi:4-aminobutyrate aminotransferase-like enzyme
MILMKRISFQHDHPDVIGEVRGQGLLWAIEIIENRVERLPSPRLATEIMTG